MSHALDPEDARLDVLWRARFGQPLPIRGCASFALAILGEEANFAPPAVLAAPPCPVDAVEPRQLETVA